MAFPRLVDRLRYALRALPAAHEAELLDYVARAGLPCPEVVFVRCRRRFGVPWLSMLVTRSLPAADRRADPVAMAQAAANLARIGLFHPDLNPDNFIPLSDGRCAVLDLQSARRRLRLSSRARKAMASKLLMEAPAAAVPLTEAGFLGEDELGEVRMRARALHTAQLRRRIRRCVRSSSEFECRRGWSGTVHRRRRAVLEGGEWVRGGREMERMWWGDRALEVLEGRRPRLAALWKARWPLAGRAVYVLGVHASRGSPIPSACEESRSPATATPDDRCGAGAPVLAREAPVLLRGYQRYRALTASAEPERRPETSSEGSDA